MDNKDSAFKPIFGSSWDKLPPVFQKRYINRPFSNNIATVEGEMDISYSNMMACLMPLFRLLHILVPYKGNNIPVKVDFRSEMDSDAICLDRKFYFPGKPPYEFNSRMQIIKDNEVIESMFFGIGWRSHYYYDGNKVIMQHKGYVWKLFGINIPVPLGIFMGKGHAEEEVIDDNTYRVTMSISHALFGVMYRYAGNFSFTRLPS